MHMDWVIHVIDTYFWPQADLSLLSLTGLHSPHMLSQSLLSPSAPSYKINSNTVYSQFNNIVHSSSRVSRRSPGGLDGHTNNQRWDLPRVSQVESSVFLTQWSTAGTLTELEMDNPLSNIDIILQQADS